MKNKYLYTFLTLMIIAFSIQSDLLMAASSLRPEDINNPVFKKPYFYIMNNENYKAKQEFRRIADQYKGTNTGAAALLWMCSSIPMLREDYINTYREMARDYPGTRWWLVAKKGENAWLYNDDNQESLKLQGAKSIIQSINGATIDDILQDKADDFDINSVAPQYRNDLANYYFFISIYSRFNHTDDQIRILQFVGEKFPKFNWENCRFIAWDELLDRHKIDRTDYPIDSTPPEIRVIASHDNQSIGNDQPKIEFELTDGDITQVQVDLRRLVFTLNGKDLTNDMRVKSYIDKSGKIDKKDPTKHPFERLRIYYKPKTPLAPGKYTVHVKAQDGLKHVAEKSWSFTVK